MKMVTYKVRVNRPCRLFIDDEEIAILEELKLAKFNLPEGEYLRKVVAIDNTSICDEAVIVLSGASKLEDIVLDTAGLEEAKRNALPEEKFKVGDWYFEPTEDRLSVELSHHINDEYFFETVNIPEQIVYAGYVYPVTSIGGYDFYECPTLKSVIIPNSITSIGESAFFGCESLISVVIPNSVISIGNSAFLGCESLSNITIPNSVRHIGAYAYQETGFYNDKFNWKEGALYINNCLIAVNENLSGNYTIKHGTRLIASSAFFRCDLLKSVTIPNSIASIGERVFEGCDSLISITIPSSVMGVGANAFLDCRELSIINYKGTKEQWNKIELDDNWNNICRFKEERYIQIIRCSDGEIHL